MKSRSIRLLAICLFGLFLVVPSAFCDITNGLVLHCKGAGNALDSSSAENHGSWLVSPAAYTNGVDGSPSNAFLFNGTTGWVSVPDSASLDTDYEFTLSAWVNLRAYSDHQGIEPLVIGKWYSYPEMGDYLLLVRSGRPLFQVANRDAGYAHDLIQTEDVIPLNQWVHLACTFNRGSMNLYVNGVLETGKLSTSVQRTDVGEYTYDNVVIGGLWNDSCNANGAIDDVMIYNRALGADEIGTLFRSQDPSLVLHYTFDADSGASVLDESGNGYTGTTHNCFWTDQGKIGGAMSFDGATSFVDMDRLAGHTFGSAATIALWARWTNSLSRPVLVSGHDSAFFDEFVLRATDAGGFDADNAAGTSVGSGWNDGKWHHIVAVYDDANHRVTTYVDGLYAGQEARADSFFMSLDASHYSIGQEWDEGAVASQFWHGTIDDVRIYDGAMSGSQVLHLYKNLSGLRFDVAGDPSNIGAPGPYPYGTNYVMAGEGVTNTVASPVSGAAGVRYVCTGWTGSGDVPISGTSNRVVFTASTNSALIWNWRPEYYLLVSSGGYGGVDIVSSWRTNSEMVTLTATGQVGCTFWRWAGDVPPGASGNNPLVLTMDRARTVTAQFSAGTSVGLVGWYKGDGSALDSSGAGNHGSWLLSPAAYTNGVEGSPSNAFHFNGVTGRVQVPDSASLDTDYEFSLALWINPKAYLDEVELSSYLIAKWNYAYLAGDYTFCFHPGMLVFSVANKNSGSMVIDYFGTPIVPTNAWSHVAATFNRGAMKIYVDGVLATNKVSSTVTNTTLQEYTWDDVTIGSHGESDNYNFNGAIDDVRIYNRELTGQDMADLYALGGGLMTYQNLVVNGNPSLHAVPTPYDYGTNQVASNSLVAASVPLAADITATSRWFCVGWTGSGSVPSDGGSNAVSFTIVTNSVLTWQWQQQYRLEVAAGTGGGVSTTGDWANAGSVQAVTASASNGYHFACWSGDVPAGDEMDNPLSLTMSQARTVTAVFAPNTFSVSGKTYYWGTQSGPVTIEAYDTARGGIRIGSVTTSQPGSYTLSGLPGNRIYWLSAYLDDDEDGVRDSWEPMAEYSGNPVALGSANITGIDLQLRRLNPPVELSAHGAADGISLKWEPGVDPGVDGYNLYRFDPNWGQFDLLNNAPLSSLSYLDGTASAGIKYWYYVTAVSYSGLLGSYMQSPASDLTWGMWGQLVLWMPDYRTDTNGIARLRINVDDAEGILSSEMIIRVKYDPLVLTPLSEVSSFATVEKTALTRDMHITTLIGPDTVQISASNAIVDHATLKILGCAFESSPNHPIPILGKYSLDAGANWISINGYQDINNGREYALDLGSIAQATNVLLQVRETRTGTIRESNDGAPYVKIYRNGDTVTNVPGIYGQESLKQYLAGIVDSNLVVHIGTNDAIWLFELSDATSGPAADYQDVVALVEYNKGSALKGAGHLFDVLFQVNSGVARGTKTTNSFDYVLMKNQAGALLTVDYTDQAALLVTNRFVLGDLNGDGYVTVNDDFTLAMKIAVGPFEPTAYQLLAGDIDGDGRITKTDATLIHRIAKGLPINADGTVPPAGGMGLLDDPVGLDGEGYQVSLGSAEGQTNGVVRVPVLLSRTEGVASIDVRVSYNSYLLSLAGVLPGPLSGTEWGLEYAGGAGYVDIVISAPTQMVTAAGVVAYVDFLVNGSAPVGTMSELTITRHELGGIYGGELSWWTGITESNGCIWVVMGTADSDGDGLTDYQEQCYDGSLLYDPRGTDTDASNPDSDGDGMKDGHELRACVDPLNRESVLELVGIGLQGGQMMVQWRGGTTGTQYLEWASSLGGSVVWTPILTNQLSFPVTNTFSDPVPGNTGYYRIRVP